MSDYYKSKKSNNKSLMPKPTKTEVGKYLKLWDSLDNYVLQENSLKKLFIKTYPLNTDINDVLIKVCTLNDFYSTNIFSPYTVAKHIVNLKIDKYLIKDDPEIVDKISKVKMSGNKMKNFYSFATKYCSHHRPNTYPIYDSYVEKVLLYFKKIDNFSDFKKDELKIFSKYKIILNDFVKFYGLSNYNSKEIDKYLWQLGKEYFPKKYKKQID